VTGQWAFWIDRGGTFTDVVARRPDGSLVVHKLLSEDPGRYEDAAVEGIRRLLGVGQDEPVPSMIESLIDSVRMGTTVATNALLERTGEPTVLVITRGFGDALRIATQHRPRIFARQILLPELLHCRVIEADERIGADGAIVEPFDPRHVTRELQRAFEDGIRSVAIVTMHGYRRPDHERAIADIARRIGFTQVSESHRVSPLMKLIPRGDTTVVDAYLSPILRRYVDHVASQVGPVPLLFMQSNGGLTEAHRFRGKDAILSGPAGGVVGMVKTSQRAGFDRVIGFDMGGTSTDVSHFAGELERELDTEVAGVRMRAPMMSINTVAAGGGSILHFDGSRFRVGPDSAGAEPGPACYRRGGPLTVTDANLTLGRIQPAFFPHVFGPDGTMALDADVVRERFVDLAAEVGDTTAERVATGFLEIAVANMANAITKISVQRGYDVTRYVLATFGGAGGQHACAVADALGMTQVLIHPLAGVLSAYGMGLADITAMREISVEQRLDQHLDLSAVLAELEHAARNELGADANDLHVVHRALLRYEGTDTAVAVGVGPIDDMIAEFEAVYRQRFSFTMAGREIVVEAVSVEAIARTDHPADVPMVRSRRTGPPPAIGVPMFVDDSWTTVELYQRDQLDPGDTVNGPAIVVEANATTVVEPGWRAVVDDFGHLILTRVEPRRRGHAAGTDADPVTLEIFNNLFMSVAEQMGVRLQSTAQSVNIKERLDFSCALFDADGHLLANAPHIPVHLGSMGRTVEQVVADRGDSMRPGDVYVLNDPYHGGTHLPDVTVVTPVFSPEGAERWFFVASRGHHAEIGGITPGSMPAFSTTVHQEGVLLRNELLVDGPSGQLRETEMLHLLESAQHPSRSPQTNLADLRAQIAANNKGVEELHAMVADFGLEVVAAYMTHVQNNAEEAVRRLIAALSDGSHTYQLDNGSVIEVKIRVDPQQRSAEIDFTGTSPQSPDNFNAPTAVTMAAVLYVFRTLIDEDIPINAGCLRPLRVIIPPGCLLSPEYPAAVVAGNVETSQAITAALYAALGVQAEGSGTMNNVTFGNERHQYYETVASGSGAGEGFAGTDVVQTHMTNSRLTDPEVLEWRYPVRLESYEILPGTGGAGRWPGGNGGRRRIRFLEPMTVTTLASHRRIPPIGMAGGSPGALGRHWVEHPDGSITAMEGCDSTAVAAGDVFVVQTPGGGGFGPPG
jgi:5-oxoprolinase (ATP-hydrolysing)